LVASGGPDEQKAPKYIDWGYGQKKRIGPDGTETIEKVPTAPREGGLGGGLLGKHSPEEIKLLADAIENGHQIPDFKALYGAGAPLKAELEKRGLNVWRLQREAEAIKRHTATMNGPQMVRLGQTIDFANHSLDQIEDLYNKWNQLGFNTRFKGFNKMALSAAAATGGDAGAIAQTLLAQVGDLTSELGTIYKGGGASTDESLKLASQNLNASWDEKTFPAAIKAIRRNMGMREDAMTNVQPYGVRPDSPLMPQQSAPSGAAQAPGQAPAAAAPAGGGAAPVGTIIRVGNQKQIKTEKGWAPYNQ
jgi:hypothetical protein